MFEQSFFSHCLEHFNKAKPNIKQTNSYLFLNVHLQSWDCHSFLQIERDRFIKAEDAQSIIKFFKHKQVEDLMFFICLV